MHHGVAYLDACRKSIHDEPARFALQNRNQIGKRGQISLRGVQSRSQLPFESLGEFQQLFAILVANH